MGITGRQATWFGSFIKVAAYNGASLEAKTVALAEGPVYNSVVCDRWCDEGTDGPTYNSCRLSCGEELTDLCYYSGGFKVLLDESIEDVDLEATWEGLSDELTEVEYNSTVLMVLE